MVRVLGVGPKKIKQRYSTSALTPAIIQRDFPMYQYAIEEFSGTVPPGTSNDDGKGNAVVFSATSSSSSTHPSSLPTVVAAPQHQQHTTVPPTSTNENDIPISLQSSNSYPSSLQAHASCDMDATDTIPYISTSNTTNQDSGLVDITKDHPFSKQQQRQYSYSHSTMHRSTFENDMPDATYEEIYGPAWTGGTIKYIYPIGYQSMRPRSCPWRLSIVVTVVFTWLSIFIVGHCSDQTANNNTSTNSNNKNNYNAAADSSSYSTYFDDDFYYIATSWCGSRPLYLMWVASMMITGLSAAYCSVIGYIKIRDFAVANSRSQPPGVVGEGKSDYYVRLQDHHSPSSLHHNKNHHQHHPQRSIYQSDGTPQFWGSQIYRPTQAAVAVTSR